MTNDQDIYRERIASDADATPADQFKPPATISEYIESPAVRKMALYGIIGGVVGIALAALLIFLIGLVFGGSGGATIDASRFGRHDDFIGSAIALLLFVEVLAAMIVGAASLVSIGIGLGVRRAATYHDNPDGYVAIAVALGLCVLGTPFGLLNPVLMVAFAGGAYLIATFRQKIFRNIALILLFSPIIVPVAIIAFVLVASIRSSAGDTAKSTLSQWELADQKYKADIADRERAAGRG